MNTPDTTPRTTSKEHWLARWRRLASLTSDLTQDDPRLPTILALLHQCDDHWRANNDQAFIETGKRIAAIMSLPKPTELLAHSD